MEGRGCGVACSPSADNSFLFLPLMIKIQARFSSFRPAFSHLSSPLSFPLHPFSSSSLLPPCSSMLPPLPFPFSHSSLLLSPSPSPILHYSPAPLLPFFTTPPSPFSLPPPSAAAHLNRERKAMRFFRVTRDGLAVTCYCRKPNSVLLRMARAHPGRNSIRRSWLGPVWDLFCSAFFSFRFLGFVAFNLFARPIAVRARCAFAERGERGERRQAGRTQDMGCKDL